MSSYMDYQFSRIHNEGFQEDVGNYYQEEFFEDDQGEYFDSHGEHYEESELMSHEIDQSFMNEEVSCCPMEMIHRRRHSLSYRPNIKKGVRKTDVSKIPKFRNPWDVQGELQPKRSKDVPLSYDEARFIREIWQDTRAQYEPSDGEIEEEFLFEEEYDDLNAEKRRNMLVKNGASLVRYSRHYELPTISTIIKSSNPEQFRSRSFSPVGARTQGEFNNGLSRNRRGSQTQIRGQTRQQYERGVREDFNFDNNPQSRFMHHNRFENRDRFSRVQNMNQRRENSLKQNNARGRRSIYQNDQIIGEEIEQSNINHRYNELNPNELVKGYPSNITPVSSRHRNTALGIPTEFDHLNETNHHNSASVGSRRATSPELLSPTKSTGRGPPPKIGILEPVETSEGLISPVNKHKASVMNTPRIGNLTSRSAASSILGGNRHDVDHLINNHSDNHVPVISPTGKQTIVFHMLPDNENNNSKATIFADPDTQNIVTELHIKPGVDINVISTPTGPAIEYEISGGRNAKAHINFSANPNSDSSISIGDIPKIQTPRDSKDQLNHGHDIHSPSFKGHNHNYSDHSRSQSRRRSSLEENGISPHHNNDLASRLNRTKVDNNNNYYYLNLKQSSQQPKLHINNIVDCEEKNDEVNHLKNNSQILNNTIDEAGKIFSEIEKDIQNQSRELPEYLEFEHDNQHNTNIETSTNFHHISSSQNEAGMQEKVPNINNIYQDINKPVLGVQAESDNHSNIGITKSHPNPFLPVKKIQKRSGFSGCIMNTLTCSKVESSDLKTFRSLNPVEMIDRSPENY